MKLGLLLGFWGPMGRRHACWKPFARLRPSVTSRCGPPRVTAQTPSLRWRGSVPIRPPCDWARP